MLLAIANTPRDYAWGGQDAITRLLGLPPTGGAEAELWLGAHPGSPSTVLGESATLGDRIHGRLPFLLKLLAAQAPLSLQVHPGPEQARAGFARENAAGIPLDSPTRNYRDEYHKPELVYALSERFEALCGFRPVAEVRAGLERLLERRGPAAPIEAWLRRLVDDASIKTNVEWLITGGEGVADLVDALVGHADGATAALVTVAELGRAYPGDPGIAVSFMLNRVSLKRGEVLYLPAGNIHAYLSGVGIELMAASDNVLRGGLTSKHVDVGELLSVLDFRPLPVPYLEPQVLAPGVRVYRPDVPDFVLVVIERTTVIPLTGDAIALCIEGDFVIRGEQGERPVARGDAVFASADESELFVAGTGLLFLATTG